MARSILKPPFKWRANIKYIQLWFTHQTLDKSKWWDFQDSRKNGSNSNNIKFSGYFLYWWRTLTGKYKLDVMMDAITYTAARAKLASNMDRVCENHDTDYHAQLAAVCRDAFTRWLSSIRRYRLGEYLYWQTQDKQMVQRINKLIREIQREPFAGIGKPDPLKRALSGYWSMRTNDEHRIIYRLQNWARCIVNCSIALSLCHSLYK